ncbi:MAG: hypothetical protein DRI81_09265 [Chloroflexi bacterium]|nr:MAG: hypothetical protein DRI81_09265 [Chloroflexota bacterium]
MRFSTTAKILLSILLAFTSLIAFFSLTAAQEPVTVCFWSAQGQDCVERWRRLGSTGTEVEGLLATLLEGPTAAERARGVRSAIPVGTVLGEPPLQSGGTVTVYLKMPPDALRTLDHASFEVIVEQIGWTLEPLGWRDLRIQVWDPVAGAHVPLSAFLPQIPVPRKETALPEPGPSLANTGQPPAAGQGQPAGALSDKTVYVSAGHGWQWNDYVNEWRTQRPAYQDIIEDHNNAEAVNQYLLQYLWNAGAMVWPVRERNMITVEVIIDNDAPGPGAGYSETGAWTTVSGTGYNSSDYRQTEIITSGTPATAVWTATLPSDGEYAVYVWYRPGADRASDARYTVHHAGGETTVVVDQRYHGITWHHVGDYGFRGGEVATVTLSNLSSQTGNVVVADAIRFGGGLFDDLTGIGTTAPAAPDKPWWEVATFYYAQRMGMSQPPGDVTARPIYARWEHAGTGDDAVYVSWHTNGYNGAARGTETYVHSGESLPRTQGSLTLCHTIHTEIVHDIRAGWDPFWTDRGEKTRNLGELRMLWDENESARIPGALTEIAFHDNPDDADALKEPAFQMLAARAVYQGIVKYFEERDGVSLTLLPEPPTHLVVQNAGGGQVRVSWQPSPTDTVGLVGDAATGYRVYTSTNGLGWSNGVSVTGTTAYTITNLVEGQLLFVRVSATNEGGESFSTETLAAHVEDGTGLLLVNGFDRLNSTMLIPENDPVEGNNLRMLLDRMNRYDYAIQHGETITYPFDSSSNEAVQEGIINLDDYGVVDWILGEESNQDETLNGTEQSLLSSYLEGGGALFISGAEIGWDLYHLGSSYDRAFYTTTLRAEYADDDAGTYEVAPVSGSILDGLPAFSFDALYDADYPDQIAPTNGSSATLTYSGGQGGVAAIQYQSEMAACPRLVYFGFPFETIRPEQRVDVMARVMSFLSPCLPQSLSTKIGSPAHLSAHNTPPPFAGSAKVTGTDIERVEAQIQHPNGEYWADSAWVTPTTWLTASGGAVWTYTLPALSGDGDYYLRARAWTTDSISDTSPAEVVFTYDTLPPTATTLITPTSGITFPAVTSVSLMWEAVPADSGSPLAYVLELDGQLYTTTQAVYTTGYVAEGTHAWGVRVFDEAGNYSEWVTDTFAVVQHQVYLPLTARNFSPEGGGGGPCVDVILNGGFESDEGWLLNHATYTTTHVYSGTRSARVGTLWPGQVSYSSVAQTMALTEGITATLQLWLYPTGSDASDTHYIILYDGGGQRHDLEYWLGGAPPWQKRVYDLSDYLGQTVTLYVGTRNDGEDDTAMLYVDGVVLKVCP